MCANMGKVVPKRACKSEAPPCVILLPCILVEGSRRLYFGDDNSLCGNGDYYADDYAKTLAVVAIALRLVQSVISPRQAGYACK